jgi:hypothetical protein
VKPKAPFDRHDLDDLDDRLLSRARRVVPMHDVACGDTGADVIGLRHDVDDNPGSFDTALAMARWECDHGYASTYFLLHGSHYWNDDAFVRIQEFEELGHEVGLHVNAIAEAFRQRRDPHLILTDALRELRATGVRVIGCVAHGDPLCHAVGFVNDEIFVESPRPDWGIAERTMFHQGVAVVLSQAPRKSFGLDYDAAWLSRGDYLSDSSGVWSQPFDDVVNRFGGAQLHVLMHPDWWADAFARERVG